MNLSVEIEISSKVGLNPPNLEQLKRDIQRTVAFALLQSNDKSCTSTEYKEKYMDNIRVELPRGIQHLDIR